MPIRPEPCRGCWGSEFWRRRDRLKNPPRLGLPVDDDVLPDWGRGGVGKGSSSRLPCREPLVGDLPRLLSFDWPNRVGDDRPDRVEAVESLRRLGYPGAVKETPGGIRDGDGRGDERPLPALLAKGRCMAVRGDRREGERRWGDPDNRLWDGRRVKTWPWAGAVWGILTGSGKRGPLFFLRRGRRKKVVVVDTVWVVVVVA